MLKKTKIYVIILFDNIRYYQERWEKMKYEIYCKNTLIGVLEVNSDGQHKYTPNKEGVEIAKKEVSLSHEMQVESDWREPIPFFKNRIENAKRFSDGEIIGYHTDQFKMIRIE